jgi:hypothetical protein
VLKAMSWPLYSCTHFFCEVGSEYRNIAYMSFLLQCVNPARVKDATKGFNSSSSSSSNDNNNNNNLIQPHPKPAKLLMSLHSNTAESQKENSIHTQKGII